MNVIRALAAAGAALMVTGLTGSFEGTAAASHAATAAASASASRLAAAPGSQLWVSRYYAGEARSVAVSPDGTRVYVTGTGYRLYDRTPYTTVAYDAASGMILWVRSYGRGTGGEAAEARAVAVSPDGTKVFVTGSNPAFDYPVVVTVAYDASTGALLWVAKYSGPYVGGAVAAGMAVTEDGTRLVVAGTAYEKGYGGGDTYYAAVAYDTRSGSRAWATLYNGSVHGTDHASAVAVSPGGHTVFVTGASGADYGTVAYGAAKGTRLWTARYNGPAHGGDAPSSIAVNPAGSRVFVTGYSWGKASKSDYATVAYSAATGARLWATRYNGPGSGNDAASSIAVSSGGGRRVFVTGYSYGGTSNRDYATIAYNSVTGSRLWVRRYAGPGNGADAASAVTVSQDAGTVFVTGSSYGGPSRSDYATAAYRAATGTRLWVSRYGGPGNGDDHATSIAVNPRGGTVFVTGTSPASDYYATVAYRS